MTYTLYIGADNESGALHTTTIEHIISERHQGFTLYLATGYWLGTREDTAVVVIEDEESKVLETINILKTELKQDAIGYQVAPAIQFA